MPRSKCNVGITLHPQGNALTDRANESTVWTKVMIDGLAIEDITTNKLIKEADTMVDEVHLDVVLDANEVHHSKNINLHNFVYLISGRCK